jgi:hypothetical protein
VDAQGDIVQFSHEGFTLTKTGLDFWALLERELKQLQAFKLKMVAYNAKQ